MASVPHDLRCGLRILTRSPGFAVVVVALLALGIGAATAMFSILNALLLRDLPVREPGRLVQLSGLYRNGSVVPFSYPMFEQIARGQRVFSALLGRSGLAKFNVELNGIPFLAEGLAVTGNYYSDLGATPLLGRLIVPGDIGPVAVIGYDFWSRHFGRDPAAIGKAVRLEGRVFTIVGVTRKWFAGMTPGQPAEITIPITAAPFDLESRSRLWVFPTGRLRDGIGLQQARAQLQSFWPEALAATVPAQSAGERRRSYLAMRLQVEPAATGVRANLRARFVRPLYPVMGVVVLILLVACVNVSTLTLARAARREREMSTRVALGATGWQIVRQGWIESLLLSGIGSMLALALAYWGSRFLIRLTTGALLDLRPDWRVFSFAAITALAAGLLAGFAPAWFVSRAEPADALRGNDRTTGRATGALGKTLIATQIALSLVLLQGAALFLRTLESLRAFDPGFERMGLLEVNLRPKPGAAYQGVDMNSYRSRLLDRVAAIPGVLSAAFSSLPIPAGEQGWRDTVSSAEPGSDPGVLSTLAVISPHFYRTLGIPLITGRDFDRTDDARHPLVAIVDSHLARRLRPLGGVTGVRIRFGVQPEFRNLQIVGVARAARLIDFRKASAPVIYVPSLQHPDFSQHGTLVVRASRPASLARAVEEEIRSAGREYPAATNTLEQVSEHALVHERAAATLSGFFAVLAVLLSGIGLFGLMSYSVTRRTREVGIRLALGLQPGRVVQMILREALLVTLAGIAVGVPCALAAARLVANLLFGLSPRDPSTLAMVAGTLLAVGVLAGYVPARRAMKLDPMAALKHE